MDSHCKQNREGREHIKMVMCKIIGENEGGGVMIKREALSLEGGNKHIDKYTKR